MARGVQERLAEVAVGGKEEQSRGVQVKAADREEPGIVARGHELGDRATTVGVAHGGDAAGRLVEHDARRPLLEATDDPVDGDDVTLGVDLAPELAHDDSVHAHAPRRHKALGAATACDARASEEAL